MKVVFISKKVDTFKGSWGAYGAGDLSEVSRGYAALWLTF